jgi:cell division septum initiation protein DivIVA
MSSQETSPDIIIPFSTFQHLKSVQNEVEVLRQKVKELEKKSKSQELKGSGFIVTDISSNNATKDLVPPVEKDRILGVKPVTSSGNVQNCSEESTKMTKEVKHQDYDQPGPSKSSLGMAQIDEWFYIGEAESIILRAKELQESDSK